MKAPNLKNAVKSACKVAKAVVKGESLLLDEASVNQRLAACESCPKFEPKDRQCLACTCLVDIKAQLTTERCPLHRWVVTNR